VGAEGIGVAGGLHHEEAGARIGEQVLGMDGHAADQKDGRRRFAVTSVIRQGEGHHGGEGPAGMPDGLRGQRAEGLAFEQGPDALGVGRLGRGGGGRGRGVLGHERLLWAAESAGSVRLPSAS